MQERCEAGRPDITVLLATANRCGPLRETVADVLALVAGEHLVVDLVVIDSASRDQTPAMLAEWEAQGLLRSLRVDVGGKNLALNAALSQIDCLGELVVFADDDIRPEANWLQAFWKAAAAHPDHDVFGGRCRIAWPVDPPGWALDRDVIRWGFGSNWDMGPNSGEYPQGRYPLGFNYAVRRDALLGGLHFDEAMGPRPDKRYMGGETSFQMGLERRGHRTLYVGDAVVDHKVTAEMVTVDGILRRASTIGRTGPRLRFADTGIPEAGSLRCVAGVFANGLRWLVSHLVPTRDRRVLLRVRALRGLANNVEVLRQIRTTPRRAASRRGAAVVGRTTA